MAYTTQQLVTAYTNANLGKAPDQATTLTLDAYATQSQVGGITDATALSNTLKLVNNTTAVAIETYQFFTGKAPSADGLAFLVNSATNANDLNDAAGVYAKFSAENRFINFAVDLGVNGEGATNFATLYGGTSVSYQQVVASAYDKIIGNATAAAAGVDVNAAVAFFSRQANIDFLKAYLTANGYTDATKLDLAVKAALIGEILNAATVSGLGAYAQATAAMINDLSDGALTNSASASIFTTYPGTGGGVAGKAFVLTGDIDTLVGTNNDDTFSGSVGGVVDTVQALDSVDGGAGFDTLNLSDAKTTAALNTAAMTVKNVEVINLTSSTGLVASGGVGTLDTSAWTGLATANVNLGAPAAAQSVTVGTGTSLSLTVAGVAANNLTLNGGSAVTLKATGQTTGTITVGATTAPTGAVTINNTGVYTDGADVTLGAISVKGGSSVTVTQATGITAAQVTAAKTDTTNFTLKQSDVTVTGTSATKSVTVTQAAAVTEVDSATVGKIGVSTGAVTINDVNASDATKAGTITTVTLANGAQTINSNALSALNLSGANAVTVNLSATNTTTSKALTINAAGGTSTVSDANNVLTSASVNSSVDGSAVQVSGTSIATVNLGGTKSLTFTTGGTLTGLKTVNVVGSGIVTADVSGYNGVTKVDTTGSTGSSIVTINGATTKIAYNGGAGVDTVTVKGTVDADASIKLGAGNDRLLAGTGATVNTSTATVIDGGDGVDALASSLVTVGNASMFKNFEVINLSNTSGATFDIALLTGSTVQSLELNGGTGTGNYASITTAQGLNVTGTSTSSDATLGFTGVTGTADAYTITFNALSTGTADSPATIDAGTVRFAGIEAVNVVSGTAGGVNSNKIVLNDANARTLVVTGSQAADISFDTAFGTAGANGLSSIDASAASGGVKITTSTAVGIADAGLTIKGGAGADTITVANLGASAVITVTAGAGKDTIDVSTNTGIIGSGATAAVHTTVTDFGSGDSLALKNQGTETFTSAKVDVSSFSSLAAILDSLAAGNGGTNGIIQWFQYGGNTYVVEDNTAGNTFASTDIVVKLTGLVDLSTATGAGTNVLSLA